MNQSGAFACSMPLFELPQRVQSLYKKQSNPQTQLSVKEQKILEMYETDKERFHTIYNKRYPCMMLPTDKLKELELPLDVQKELEAEIEALLKKWEAPSQY